MESIPDYGNAHGRIWVREFGGEPTVVNAFLGRVTEGGGTVLDVKYSANENMSGFLVIYRAKEFIS